MSEEFEEISTYFEGAFKKLNSKINKLFEMKDDVRGFLFIKWHKWSAEELFNSSTYQSVKSMINKIADDVNNWHAHKVLSLSDRLVYNENRDAIEERLEKLEDDLRKREPTTWEKLVSFFRSFISYVVQNLPKIWNGLAIFADKYRNKKGLLGSVCRGILGINKLLRKLLVSKEKKYIS